MDQNSHHTTGEQGSPVVTSYRLLDALSHPACIIGLSGEMLFTNKPFTDLFEKSGQIITLDFTHPFSAEYRKRIAMAYMRALKGVERQVFAIMKGSDGKKIPMEIYLFPMFQDGSVSSILVFIKPQNDDRLQSFDHNTAMLLEHEDAATGMHFFEYAPFPIIRFDRQGSIVNASVSFEGFFGLGLGDLQDHRNVLFKAVSLYDFERIRKAVADIFNGIIPFKRLGEIKVIPQDHAPRWVNAVIFPVVLNKEIQVVDMILEDISRFREMEERLSALSHIQIVGDLMKGLLHSFNNMINVVLTKTQLLLQITEKDAVLDGLKVIENASIDSVKQIRRIQDFMGGEKLDEQQVEDVIDVIEDSLEFAKIHFKVEEQEKRRKIRIERRYFCLYNIRTDTRLLKEILVTMIFRVSSFIRTEGTINIILKDNGSPSIIALVEKERRDQEAPEQAPMAPFADVDIRRIAEKLNIKIIEEESNTSYSIKAALPPSLLIGKGPREPEQESFKLRDLDILVVEDEKALRDILEELFDSMGNRVVLCESGEEALEVFRKGTFHLVVTDYGIPGISGIELAARVKEIDEKVTTVLLSGWMLTDLKAYKNVVDLFLAKPFKLDDLIREISKVMKSRDR
ncbi:MAG: response regulator [Spirochaetes bacterium]|nr:MAG: response regulator [Spirochaetota bacterium]